MPIRARFLGSRLEPRRAAAQIRARAIGRVRRRTLVATGVWLCLQISSAALAAQATASQRSAVVAPPATLDTAVRAALQQYSAALESLDADEVKKIHPSVDGDGLKRAFREMRELKVSIDTIKVLSSDAATVRVSCRVTQTFVPKAGSKQNSAVTRVMRLRRLDTALVIDGFER
jgi:hypothetical protein